MSNSNSAQLSAVRRPYGGISIWGVPYSNVDIEFAVESIKAAYVKNTPSMHEATMAVLENNERVVSRCGTLMSFSGMLIAVSLFVANNPKVLQTIWQQWAYYITMLVWVVFILQLLWSLAHRLPPPWDFNAEDDFDFTARLYFKRMGKYNLALIASTLCFGVMLFLLAPFSSRIADLIFIGK